MIVRTIRVHVHDAGARPSDIGEIREGLRLYWMTPFSVAISDRGDLTIEYTGLLKLLGPELTEVEVRRTLGLFGLTAGRIDVQPSMIEWDESGLPEVELNPTGGRDEIEALREDPEIKALLLRQRDGPEDVADLEQDDDLGDDADVAS